MDIKKRFADFELQVNCELAAGKCGVFGPSGSGKSTLMHILAGLLSPDEGRIVLDETILFDSDAGINLPPQQRRIGVVFQQAHLFPHMNVRGNLLYGWQRTAVARRQGTPEAIIEVLGLSPLLERRVTSLSGGERQRVALGRAMLACPRLILMDEPLNGLDQELKLQIIAYLDRVLTEFGMPLLFISHSLQEMELMTDEVLVLGQGTVQQHLNTDELLRPEQRGLFSNGAPSLVACS